MKKEVFSPARKYAGLTVGDTVRVTRELQELIADGAVDRFVSMALSADNLSAAFSRYRAQLQLSTRDATAYFGKSIPGVKASGISAFFNQLNPRVIDAMRELDTKVMQRLATDTRETVRAILENALRDGKGPSQASKAIRELIGLGPTQIQEVANFRAALEAGQVGKALGYAARDRRFDASVKSGALDAAKIDKMVEAYTKRRVAINAATTARTATLEAYKTGQRLSWYDAIDKGIVEDGSLMKRWSAVAGPGGDGRNREEHLAMHGETVPFDETYSNGDMYAGEGSPWNCRCLDIVFVASPALTA